MKADMQNIIKQIIAEAGEGILSDPKRMMAVFTDRAAGIPIQERTAMARCIELRVFAEMKGFGTEEDLRSRRVALAGRVQAVAGVDMAKCEEAIAAFELAVFGRQPVSSSWHAGVPPWQSNAPPWEQSAPAIAPVSPVVEPVMAPIVPVQTAVEPVAMAQDSHWAASGGPAQPEPVWQPTKTRLEEYAKPSDEDVAALDSSITLWYVISIAQIFLCSGCLALIAVFQMRNARTAFQMGDYDLARASLRSAKTTVYVLAGIAIALLLVQIALGLSR